MVHDSNEAEDLTQDTFLHLFRKLHSFRGESRFSTWLYRLTVNIVLMRLRKKRYPEISLDATGEYKTTSRPIIELGRPDLRLSGMLDNVNLNKAINQLPDGYRAIFVLHDVEGYGHREIAKLLGCSIGSSKSRVFKARRQLRELLHDFSRSRERERA
jgi:RNA polymerase sigma-70 factor (ECF subfamily)